MLTVVAFTGIVTAVAAWSIWGQDMFPKEADPTGGKYPSPDSLIGMIDAGSRSRYMDERRASTMAGSSESLVPRERSRGHPSIRTSLSMWYYFSDTQHN